VVFAILIGVDLMIASSPAGYRPLQSVFTSWYEAYVMFLHDVISMLTTFLKALMAIPAFVFEFALLLAHE
jgi:hypothetical protein